MYIVLIFSFWKCVICVCYMYLLSRFVLHMYNVLIFPSPPSFLPLSPPPSPLPSPLSSPYASPTTDTTYILAYSVIMLHTSLHNPSVKDKPTIERFIIMNRGIDNGKNLPDDLLTVRTHPLVIDTFLLMLHPSLLTLYH